MATGRLIVGNTRSATPVTADAVSPPAGTDPAEEQAALRRVATLVAKGVPPAELFQAVTVELARGQPIASAPSAPVASA